MSSKIAAEVKLCFYRNSNSFALYMATEIYICLDQVYVSMLDGASRENPSSPSHLQNLSSLGSFSSHVYLLFTNSFILGWFNCTLKFPAKVQNKLPRLPSTSIRRKGNVLFTQVGFLNKCVELCTDCTVVGRSEPMTLD